MSPVQPKPSDEYQEIGRQIGGTVFLRWFGFGLAGLLSIALAISVVLGNATPAGSTAVCILVLFFCLVGLAPWVAVEKIEKFLPVPGKK